jgi:uncharacterized protein YbaR (Trm112 family)
MVLLEKLEFLLCPDCKGKSRTRVQENTVLTNYVLFCPKCKKEFLVNVEKFNMEVIKVPAAEPQ